MSGRDQGELVDFYADPMVYDVLYSPGTAYEVDQLDRIEARFSRLALTGRRVWLEPACGSGRYLRVLVNRGRRCIGFDRDEGMLEYARRRIGSAAGCRLFQAELDDFAAEIRPATVDFAFIPVNTLRHLLDGGQVRRHFEQMGRVLKSGGLYVVGLSLARYDEQEADEDSWGGRRGRLTVHQNIQYLPPDRRRRRERVISHLRVERPSGTDYLDSTYELRSYDEAQWTRLIARTVFERAGVVDDEGVDRKDEVLDYQFEVLRRK